MTTRIERSTLLPARSLPLLQRIQRLHTREERERMGLFYIEGMRFVAQAVQHHAPIEHLVVCPPLLTHPYARHLVQEQKTRGISVVEVSQPVMKRLSQVVDSQGLGAVVRQRWLRLATVKPRDELCWIAVETIRAPGNLGTILRTSDAVGGAGLIILGETTDPYDPATVRATMGAIFTQRLVRASKEEFIHWKRRHQYQLVGTSPRASQEYRRVHYTAPTIVLMGEERKGLPADLQALCDLMVHIPMVGASDSLNVTMATGVMLYELFHQRRRQQ